jgi:hypothetical protein
MTSRVLLPALACAGLVLCAGPALSQSGKQAAQPATPATQPVAADKAAPSADPNEAWAKLNQPGEPHKMLAAMAGDWTLEVKAWMVPGAPPSVSQATCTCKMIMDGRFLQEDVTGTMMNQPFTGMSLTGFDNIKQKYTATWIDNMTTGIFKSEGAYDPAAKIVNMSGMQYDPVSDKDVPVRTVTRLVDDKTHVFEWYTVGPDGKEVKAMEITYTRKS